MKASKSLSIRTVIIIATLTPALAGKTAMAAPDLTSLFNDHYHNHYEERRCGDNALGFIEDANRKTGAAKDLYLVMIEDKGFSNFGLVQAEMARWPARPGRTQDMNWGFHAIVMDRSGNVYDFDYGSKPTITGIRNYLENMFLNDNECLLPPPRRASAGETCVPRETRLRDYQVTVVPGDQVIVRDESEKKSFKLAEVWKDWRVLLPGN